MIINNYVLDTVAATGGDISLLGGILSIKADANVTLRLPSRLISQLGSSTYPIQDYLLEQAQITTVAYTAAANTTYSFSITQPTYDKYSPNYGVVQLTTTSTTGSDAQIATALTAIMAKMFPHITVSGAASPLTLTGATGYPIYQIGAITGVTVTAAQGVKTPNGTPATALSGTTTVTVTTLAAHSLAIGNVVTITSATGFTFTKDGVATVATIANARIATVPTSTTFTLDGVTGAGTNTGTIVITVVAQEAVGTAAQVTAKTGIATTTGAYYAQIMIPAGIETLNSGIQGRAVDVNQENLYVNATGSPTNWTNYKTALRNRLDGLLQDGSAADPQWVSVG